MNSAGVLALLAPAAVLLTVLREGLPTHVATSPRPAWRHRSVFAASVAAVVVGSGALVATILPAPADHLLMAADWCLVVAACYLGATLFASSWGWALPACLLLVYSLPGVVPLTANPFYDLGSTSRTLLVATVVAVATVLCYGVLGEHGLHPVLRRDTDPEDEG